MPLPCAIYRQDINVSAKDTIIITTADTLLEQVKEEHSEENKATVMFKFMLETKKLRFEKLH